MPDIRGAVETVLATPAYKERAQAIAASMTATPSTAEVLDSLLSW